MAKTENTGNRVRSTLPDVDPIPEQDADITEEDARQWEEQQDLPTDEEGLTSPTSSDVGKQTLTKADLGYDVYKEGVPEDEVAVIGHEHPDDPSAHEESQYAPGTKRK